MAAVAVHLEEPSPAAMLDARLARGWRPRASELKDGHRVLGYAACAVLPTAAGGDRRLEERPPA